MSANPLGNTRRVYSRVWDDGKFRGLSHGARWLFLYLLSAPESCALPGVHIARPSQMAETAMMERADFDQAFAQLADMGMVQADWENRLVWLSNAFRYNQPLNPSVVVAWVRELAKLPDCAARRVIGNSLYAHVSARGTAFEQALRKAGLQDDGGLQA